MKILFVCSANKIRSVTAEQYFSDKFPEHEFDSAGTNHAECLKNGTTPLTEEHLIWADKIIVMEDKHRRVIKTHSKDKYAKKVVVLGIQDIYNRAMDKSLIRQLEKKCSKYIPDQSPRFSIEKPQPYILSIGDILIDSESILNSPTIAVNMKYHDMPNLSFEPSQRILTAIQYDDIRVEIVPNDELQEELRNLFYRSQSTDVNLGIMKDGFEVYSVGRFREIFNYEDNFGFTFTPNYVTSR